MGTQRSEDFRDWDIEVGVNYSGWDQLGLPFCIWREKADNRLMLSRPRYCCVTLKDARLYFNFFNPSEDVRSMPIRLTQTPTTCRVCPFARIERGVGGRLSPARDAKQRSERVKRIEAPVEAERELVEVGL